MNNKKVILIVRDGWGYSEKDRGNAVKAAWTPNEVKYRNEYPTAILKCTGRDVGNPDGLQGGSEVGHLTMGAGRIVWQPQEMINNAIKDGSFFKNSSLLEAIKNCQKNNSTLHLAGLFSDAGVHSDVNHLYALLKLAKDNGLNKVYIHLVLDGRDVPEKSAIKFVDKLDEKIKEIGVGKIGSVVGRYYAMDRDTNWDRTKAAADLWIEGKGFEATSAFAAIKQAYDRGDKTDYYVQPTIIDKNGLVKDDDSFVWFNFRTDRSRQITAMMTRQDLCPKEWQKNINLTWICMGRYDEQWKIPVAFLPETVKNNLGEVLAKNNKKQVRIAETEKYAHVTFFFNSQQEAPYPNEDRVMVPSPKVPSYDLKPEMSAPEVGEKVLEVIGKYDFILVNFANPDLVGHSGKFEAVVKACEVVDEEVGEIVDKGLANDYVIIVGADHGNAEHMLYDNGQVDVSHGFDPVRFSFVGLDQQVNNGGLKDVAPTILEIMGIEKPVEMTGESLIKHE